MREGHDISGWGSRFWVLPAGVYCGMLIEPAPRSRGPAHALLCQQPDRICKPIQCAIHRVAGMALAEMNSTQGDLEQAHISILSFAAYI